MSLNGVVCTSSLPQKTVWRDYSDQSVPTSLDVNVVRSFSGQGSFEQKLIVPPGDGSIPYEGSATVARNCTVSLHKAVIGGFSATSCVLEVSLTKGGAYVYHRSFLLAQNENFVYEIGDIENIDVSVTEGNLVLTVYVSQITSSTPQCQFYGNFNVVVDD